MPTFRANLNAFRFDKEKYLKQFESKMAVQNRNAARAWLRAALPHIPVRTGMAKASLIPLARFLNVGILVQPVDFPSRVFEGVASSDEPSSMFESNGKGEFLFQFTINVLHYLLNEFAVYGMGPYLNPIDPTIQPPWESMEAGRLAYIAYVQSEVTRNVPRIREFIYATKISSGA